MARIGIHGALLWVLLFLFYVGMGCSSSHEPILGSGVLVTRSPEIASFHSIQADGVGIIELLQGEREGVVMTIDDNLTDQVAMQVEGGVLRIDFGEGKPSFQPSQPPIFTITVRKIDKIDLEGIWSLKTPEQLVVQKLQLITSGSSHVEIDVSGHQLLFTMLGAGSVKVKGETDEEQVTLAGMGSFFGYSLSSKRTTVDLSGTGHAEVHASEQLNVDISGSGSVFYRGVPVIRETITGVGTLRHGNKE